MGGRREPAQGNDDEEMIGKNRAVLIESNDEHRQTGHNLLIAQSENESLKCFILSLFRDLTSFDENSSKRTEPTNEGLVEVIEKAVWLVISFFRIECLPCWEYVTQISKQDSEKANDRSCCKCHKDLYS